MMISHERVIRSGVRVEITLELKEEIIIRGIVENRQKLSTEHREQIDSHTDLLLCCLGSPSGWPSHQVISVLIVLVGFVDSVWVG